MKVLHIIHRFSPAIGGSEKWCFNLNSFLTNHGITSKVATISLFHSEEFHRSLPCEKTDYFKLGRFDNFNGTHVIRYKLWSLAPTHLAAQFVKFFLHLTTLNRTEIGQIFLHSPHSFELYLKISHEIKDADIVHLHTLPYFHNIVGFVIAKLYGKKIVIVPHFHPEHAHYERRLLYAIMNRCDAVLAMTEYEKNYLVEKGILVSNIHVIGNSIDAGSLITKDECNEYAKYISEKYELSSCAKKIIFIGRKEPYKGISTLIEAAEQLAGESKEKIVLFLVGPDFIEFRNKYGEMSHSGKLKIVDCGPVTDEEKEKLIAFSNVLALPSEFEAFGIVFLEAWKYKKPVIGSDRGAIPEVIKDAGLCVRYGDSIDLKEKLNKILYNAELAQSYGEIGKQKLDKEFSLEHIGKKVLHIYRNLTPNKRKVLIVSNLFPPYVKGGAEIVAYQQARALKRIGFDINIFSSLRNIKLPRFFTMTKNGEFKITRINLYDIDFDQRYINFYKKEVMSEFNRILFHCAPDIVHFHNISSLSVEMIDECHIRGIPAVMTLHDYWGICSKNTLITQARLLCDKKNLECTQCKDFFLVNDDKSITFMNRNKILMEHLNRLNAVISPSTYLLNRFTQCGLDPQKKAVINNGIDLSRFKKIRKSVSGKFRFAFIGQVLKHKGLDILLKSVSLLEKKERARISLCVIGTGEETFVNFCKDLIKELGLADVVKFKGEVSNARIPAVLSKIDALIIPSLWPENSPVTIMEALACGTPVLASRIGGIPELIEDSVHGFLHTHNNSQELAENMRKFINQPHLAVKMRQACLERAKENDLNRIVKTIATYYDRLILSH